MNQKFNFTIATLMMAAGIGFAAPDTMGASHEVTMQFPVTRDVGIDAWSDTTVPSLINTEALSNAGTADFSITDQGQQGSVRARKSDEHGIVLDFDTAAMDAFLQANPGTATWTFSLRNTTDEGQQQIPTTDVSIVTVESTNDWAEGDGTINFANFNWTSGTSAATYFYAQTVQNNGVLDAENSLQWIDPDSGPYVFTTRAAVYGTAVTGVPDTVGIGLVENGAGVPGVSVGPTPEFTNTALFTSAALNTALDNSAYATVDLDADIVDALINDENNRGLRFGPLTDVDGGSSSDNWNIFTRECEDATPDLGQCAPFLEVTIVPAAGPDGDFDGDLDVDGADFLEWQRTLGDAASLALWEANFGTTASSTAASATGVPEPSSLLLVLLCSSAMLCTRCGNRKAA